jgi:uncharacterized membrane protein YphA (DoxX/SURF4 family)
MNTRQKLLVVALDLLLLAELTFSMYWSARTPDDMAGAFIRLFVPLVLATLVAGRWSIRRLGAADAPQA